MELHDKLEGEEHEREVTGTVTFGSVIFQILLLDIVFSIDSVITVGMTEHLPVMIAAVVISIGVMIASANSIAGFVERHPTIKVLALSFLILIGFTLVAEGFHYHVPKGIHLLRHGVQCDYRADQYAHSQQVPRAHAAQAHIPRHGSGGARWPQRRLALRFACGNQKPLVV